MFEIIDEEHDCFDYAIDNEQPTYVLSGYVSGIDYSRTDSLMKHLQDSVEGKWKGFIAVTGNLKQVTSYDYITEVKSELEDSTEIQRLIEIAIEHFSCLH